MTLIERLEAATGPDRELDAAIESERRRQQAYACGLNDKTRAYWVPDKMGFVESQGTRYSAEHYTASIDAALTLVPEGYSIELGIYVEDELYEGPSPGCCARVSKYCMGDGPGWERDAEASTPALAICIAALKAKGETE